MFKMRFVRSIGRPSLMVALAMAGGSVLGGQPALAAYRVPSSFAAGVAAGLTAPNADPPGANVPCVLTAAHPRPVVLVHGTSLSPVMDWSAMAPYLANQGFCVYAVRYGYIAGQPGAGPVAQNTTELATLIDAILAQTGARQVDIVGHSQGGMMPRQYIKSGGGAATVHRLIALAPSNHGSTLDGLTGALDLIGATDTVLGAVAPAYVDQKVGSPFLAALNAGDETPGDTLYDVIATKYDEVITPYQGAFLAGAEANITLQNGCPIEFTDHLQLPYSPRTLALVANLLDGGHRPVPCVLDLPLVGR